MLLASSLLSNVHACTASPFTPQTRLSPVLSRLPHVGTLLSLLPALSRGTLSSCGRLPDPKPHVPQQYQSPYLLIHTVVRRPCRDTSSTFEP